MTKKVIKMAIVGAGLWGESHANIYREHDWAEPVAICDLNLERANAFAKKFGISQVYSDYHEMLEKSEVLAAYVEAKKDFDAVVQSVNGIINFYITGEEPGCTHNCSTCGGCH